jgi:hypothetical protein
MLQPPAALKQQFHKSAAQRGDGKYQGVMELLGKTPSFRVSNGKILPGNIAEIRYIPLGGLDQWVIIQGESLANPALIFCMA